MINDEEIANNVKFLLVAQLDLLLNTQVFLIAIDISSN